jgi:CspA family cold shock protein
VNKKGSVRWWNEDKGHGFIRGADSVDYFVHHTGILGEGRKQLARDEEVEFDAIETEKGPRAVMVKRRGFVRAA